MSAARDESIQRTEISIRVGSVEVHADLVLPANAAAVVIHAGPREEARWLASHLAAQARFASLAVDLRADEGEPLDVAVLAQRLAVATDWVVMHDSLRRVPLAYSAVGIAAAAALITASTRREVRAIVSRSGRPDLAGGALENVRVPALLIVDESDDALAALTRSVRPRLRTSDVAIIARETIAARAADYLLHTLA